MHSIHSGCRAPAFKLLPSAGLLTSVVGSAARRPPPPTVATFLSMGVISVCKEPCAVYLWVKVTSKTVNIGLLNMNKKTMWTHRIHEIIHFTQFLWPNGFRCYS